MKTHVTDQMVAVVVLLRVDHKCPECGKDLLCAPVVYGTWTATRGKSEPTTTISTETNDSSIDFLKSCRCTKHPNWDPKLLVRYVPPFPLSSQDKNSIAKIVNEWKFNEPGLHMMKALLIECIYAEMTVDDVPHETLHYLDALRDELCIPETDDIPTWFTATVKQIDDFTLSKLLELFRANEYAADYFESIVIKELDSREAMNMTTVKGGSNDACMAYR